MTEHKWMLKHSGSSLTNMYVTVRLDPATKTVELISRSFDSVQIVGLVTKILPTYGIDAVFDESDYQNVKRPAWRLIYVLDGVRLGCAVSTIHNFSVKDGRAYDDPLKSYAMQTTVTLHALPIDSNAQPKQDGLPYS